MHRFETDSEEKSSDWKDHPVNGFVTGE